MNRTDEQLEQQLREELRDVDDLLRGALHVEPPTDLAQRLFDATIDQLDPDIRSLDQPLREALRVESPAGLEMRIYRATANRLNQPTRRAGILARIGIDRGFIRAAIAAGILVAVGAGLWFAASNQADASLDRIDMVRIERDVRQIQQGINTTDQPFEQRTLTLAVDIDRLAMTMDSKSLDDSMLDSTDHLRNDILLFEAEMNLF